MYCAMYCALLETTTRSPPFGSKQKPMFLSYLSDNIKMKLINNLDTCVYANIPSDIKLQINLQWNVFIEFIDQFICLYRLYRGYSKNISRKQECPVNYLFEINQLIVNQPKINQLKLVKKNILCQQVWPAGKIQAASSFLSIERGSLSQNFNGKQLRTPNVRKKDECQ